MRVVAVLGAGRGLRFGSGGWEVVYAWRRDRADRGEAVVRVAV